MVEPALLAGEYLHDACGLDVTVINARFAKPLDVTTIAGRIAAGTPMLVIEDHSRIGGFGAAVLELAAERGLNAAGVRLLGIPDRFVPHASRQEQLKEVGLDMQTIAETVKNLIDSLAETRSQTPGAR